MKIQQRLLRLEQSLPPDFSKLTDDALLALSGQLFNADDWRNVTRLAGLVHAVPEAAPGMNLDDLTDTELCAVFVARCLPPAATKESSLGEGCVKSPIGWRADAF